MFKNILKKLRSDRGDGSLVAMIIVLPLLLGVLFTIVDLSAYFANRAYVQTVAHNGARTVSIMGGDGTESKGTPIEKKYGLSRAATCGEVDGTGIAAKALKSTSSAIECNMMISLQEASGLINVTIQNVVCTPNSTTSIGQRTSCAITWGYGGTPGSWMAFVPAHDGLDGSSKHFAEENTTAGSSESEVNLNGNLVPRG